MSVSFGRTELPSQQQETLRKAIRLEWITIIFLIRAAVTDLMDARATTFDDARPHPVIGQVNSYLRGLEWVAAAGSRVRDEGHVFHVEAFVVPHADRLEVATLEAARMSCIDLDWRLQDVVLVPVGDLPNEVDDREEVH